MDEKKNNQHILVIINEAVMFFVETFVAITLGYFIGRALDQWLFEDRTILMYVFLVIGVFAGLSNLIRRVMKRINGGK